jgi:hypothetical protein
MKKLRNKLANGSRRGWRYLGVIVAVLASLCESQGQGTLTWIAFEGPPAFLSGDGFTEYQESGMSLKAIINQQGYGNFISIAKWRSFDFPYNGTAYIHTVGSYPVEFTSTNGLPLGLVSVDLAEDRGVSPQAVVVQFVGYRADGSTVTTNFVTDGIIGDPFTPDFQRFYFGPEFSSGLVRVALPHSQAGLDNLYVTLIPEPATGTLLLACGLSLYALRRRNQLRRP